MSRAAAASLMVRNASGDFSKCSLLFFWSPGQTNDLVGLAFAVAGTVAVDPLLQNRRRLEHHDTAGRNRHFGAGLRVTAYTLALLAHHEGAERRKFYRLALLQAVGNLLQHEFHKC